MTAESGVPRYPDYDPAEIMIQQNVSYINPEGIFATHFAYLGDQGTSAAAEVLYQYSNQLR